MTEKRSGAWKARREPPVGLVASVFIVVALFELWFFFLSGSPISQSAGTSG